jgi:hypothetical protein
VRKAILLILFFAICPNASARAEDFIVCQSIYALCTTAQCTPIAGKTDVVSCKCNVETDYSAGLKPCEDKSGSEGDMLRSRYHPIKSYARCSNSRPWAWCLDKPCVVDKSDPAKAVCACSIRSEQGSYVIVNDSGSYDPSSCTTGIYSSATVADLNQVTDYLKTHNTKLRAVPIKVYPEP